MATVGEGARSGGRRRWRGHRCRCVIVYISPGSLEFLDGWNVAMSPAAGLFHVEYRYMYVDLPVPTLY